MEGSSQEQSPSVPREREVFPPPALWYKTNAAASRDDMWAYLSFQQIVLVRPRETCTKMVGCKVKAVDLNFGGESSSSTSSKESVWPSFEIIGLSKDGYNCLNFCQSGWDFLPVKSSPLVTGCREGLVRIWNVNTGECVLFHDVHKEEGKTTPVTCLDWSIRNPKVIYSMDEGGNLVSWYLPKSLLKSFSFGKVNPTSIQASPHEDNIVSFGCKGGNIFIVKTDPTGKGSVSILHKVIHDEEVVATLWCPKLDWRLSRVESNAGQGKGAVFASSVQSAKHPVLRLWARNGEDRGSYLVGEKSDRQMPRHKSFSPLLWAINPNNGEPMLLTSTKKGSIVSFSKDSALYDLVHDVHQHNFIFGLVQTGDILWSTSYEPVIVGWNLRTMKVSCVIPTFKGICSIAPTLSTAGSGTLLGVGGVDGCIRALDFVKDYPGSGTNKAPNTSYKIRSKILSLAWHPFRDNWLGFGTDDGVIGIYELHEEHKHMRQFDRHVRGAVYAVDWGPQFIDKEYQIKKDKEKTERGEDKKEDASSTPRKDNFLLYACGGSSVVAVYPSKTSNALVNVLTIIDKANPQSMRWRGDSDSEEFTASAKPMVSKAADIRWSPDFSLFAVGYNDGRVELYTPPFFNLKCWIKCHSRAIQFLSWRPYDFHPQREPDHKERWLATCSNDGSCRLFNLESVFCRELLHNDNADPKLIISSAACLRSPNGERIISSTWSPYNPDLICTVSYDATGIIWNIRDGTPISRYFGHSHRLVACAFHPANEFKVITASDELMHDFTMHVWDYRDHPYVEGEERERLLPIKAKGEPIQIKSKEQKSKEEEKEEEDVSSIVNESQAQTKAKDLSSRLHVLDESALASTSGKGGRKKGRGSKSKSLLCATANMFINTKLELEAEIKFIVEELVEKEALEEVGEDVEENEESKQINGESTNGLSDEDSDDEEDEASDQSMIHLLLLGDYEQCVELLKFECEAYAKRGDWEKGCLLAAWMGDEDFINRALDTGHVSWPILTIAYNKSSKPSVKKACEVMAAKLILEEEFCQAATLYLLAGMKEMAVQVLVDHKLFRDAVALLKLCLPRKNPMHLNTMQQWLIQLIQDGNFETACKIYTSLNMYEDALEVIEKRDTVYGWRTGMYLAKKSGNEKKVEMLGLKYFVECMSKNEHDKCKAIIKKYEAELKWLLPLVLIHEAVFHLSNKIRDLGDCEDELVPFPRGEFKKNLLNVLNLSRYRRMVTPEGRNFTLAQKLKENLLIAVAQNKSDAELILVRSLALLLLEFEVMEDLQEECLKVSTTWLKEKHTFLYNAYVMAFMELELCQSDAF